MLTRRESIQMSVHMRLLGYSWEEIGRATGRKPATVQGYQGSPTWKEIRGEIIKKVVCSISEHLITRPGQKGNYPALLQQAVEGKDNQPLFGFPDSPRDCPRPRPGAAGRRHW